EEVVVGSVAVDVVVEEAHLADAVEGRPEDRVVADEEEIPVAVVQPETRPGRLADERVDVVLDAPRPLPPAAEGRGVLAEIERVVLGVRARVLWKRLLGDDSAPAVAEPREQLVVS